MNFEIARTIEETLGNNVRCTLNYTPEFVEYVQSIDSYYDDLEPLEDGILESFENLVKEEKVESLIATAFISDDDSYVYVDTTNTIYMLSVLPVGSNEKYRACFVRSVY